MRRALIFLLIGLFFAILFVYLLSNLSVWNTDELVKILDRLNIKSGESFELFIEESKSAGIIFDYLNLRNIVVIFITWSATFVCLFSALHMFVDKLFKRKIKEEPDYITAIRRGIFIILMVDFLVILRLFLGATTIGLITFIAFLTSFLLIELNIYRTKRKQKRGENQKGDAIILESSRDN